MSLIDKYKSICPVYKALSPLRLPPIPAPLIAVPLIGMSALAFFSARIYYARHNTSSKAAYHLWHDMDNQPRHKGQTKAEFFEDSRSMRLPVSGTVAHGTGLIIATEASAQLLKEDDHYFCGFERDVNNQPVQTGDAKVPDVKWFDSYPESLEVDAALLKLGEVKFQQTCVMCHGWDGSGNGPVHVRASELAREKGNPSGTRWTPPKDLRSALLTAEGGYPLGKMFHTINHGAGNMSGYASQLSEEEAWAIVAYVRALQRSAGVVK